MKLIKPTDIIFTLILILIGLLLVDQIEARNLQLPNPKLGSFLSRFRPNCDIHITSTHRSKKHNQRVGGASKSLHLTNRAVDIVTSKSCIKKMVSRAFLYGITVIQYPKGTHLHLDVRENVRCLVKVGSGYRDCRKGDR